MAWSSDSWRKFEARQQPDYADRAALAAAEHALARRPPLVGIGEIDALKAALARAQAGGAFLLQGGDCAESFADAPAETIGPTVDLILRMAAEVAGASGLPVIAVGRIAGQFAKPRSSPFETRNGRTLPAYRGDIVNGVAFDPAARRADPRRMLRAYDQAAAILAHLRRATLSLYTSHEALLLPYEQALTRTDPASGRSYAGSAHFLWIGDRTRFPGSAHVEFARGIANPLGVKCGRSLDPDTLLRLLDLLDPERERGRITLISRMGDDGIRHALPPLLRAVDGAGHPVLWACDPMHGNTVHAPDGVKTRRLASIFAETRAFFELVAAEGVAGASLHLEMTGDDVAECSDGPAPSTPELARRYRTPCDPRLNPAQAMAMARLVAAELTGAAVPLKRASG